MDSHIRSSSISEKNRNTELFPGVGAQPDLRRAYGLARAFVELHPDRTPGHRIVWVRAASFGSSTLSAHPRAFAVLGRHTQCGIALGDDPFVALRHLLLRSVVLPSGGFALRVFDLHTSLGFTLADGSRQTSVFAEGPVAIAVGEYAIIALPTSGDGLPPQLPPPVVHVPPDVREQMRALEDAMSPYRAAASLKTSRMTLMPRAVSMEELHATRDSGGAYWLQLARSGHEASMTIGAEDLARGVIIGRSEKCHAEVLRRITDMGTSRVHLLLLKEGATVSAYDLASTQGTWVSSERVGRIALPDTPSMLHLGTRDPVRVTWLRRR